MSIGQMLTSIGIYLLVYCVITAVLRAQEAQRWARVRRAFEERRVVERARVHEQRREAARSYLAEDARSRRN